MYLWLKYFHVLIAIVSLGTSAGMGIVMEFFGNHKIHGPYVLQAIKKIVLSIVIPGYILMLLSGAFMVHLAWSWDNSWLKKSLGFWTGGLGMLIIAEVVLAKQIMLFETSQSGERIFKILSLLTRAFGAAGGLIVMIILYFMVFKP